MDGFRKIFPTFLTHYATFLAKMAERKVVPFDEFYYQLKLMHLFLLHPVCISLQFFFHMCFLSMICTSGDFFKLLVVYILDLAIYS
jgi:hypothetical protein